jgi:hypothetical protein
VTANKEISALADGLEDVFNKAADARDGATGEQKTVLRKITKDLESSMKLVEQLEARN